MCASSWVMCFTRRSPCSVPPFSSRCSVDDSANRIGRSLVAAQPRAEQQHVARAVHRLQRHAPVGLGVRVHPEDVLLVVLQVAGGLVGLLVVEERRLHLEVAAPRVLAAAEVLELRSRSPSPSGARTASRASAPRGGRGRAASRAGGGRACAPPRAARGARRGRPASRTRCRRCGSAAVLCSSPRQ